MFCFAAAKLINNHVWFYFLLSISSSSKAVARFRFQVKVLWNRARVVVFDVGLYCAAVGLKNKVELGKFRMAFADWYCLIGFN